MSFPRAFAVVLVLLSTGVAASGGGAYANRTQQANAAQVALPSAAGTYYALAPQRILDTRDGTGATAGRLGAGATLPLQVTGRGGVPAASAVSAVVLNLTVTEPTQASYLTAYPSDVPRPTTSSLNFPGGWTGANSVTVPVHAGGVVSIYNNTGETHVIGDVVGFYASGAEAVTAMGRATGGYRGVEPVRMFDSRTDPAGPFVGGDWVRLPLTLGPDVDPHVTGLAVNVTVTGATAPGYIRTWDGVRAEPGTSTVNFVAGQTVANMSIVPAAACPDCGAAPYRSIGVKAYTGGSVHVVVDIVGVTLDGQVPNDWRFTPLNTPTRVVDTRTNQGASTFLGPSSQTVSAPPAIAGAATQALVTNTTVVQPSQQMYLTLWASGGPQPGVSNINAAAGEIISNATITAVGGQNDFTIFNNAGVTAAVMDVAGTLDLYTGPPATPVTLAQPRAPFGGDLAASAPLRAGVLPPARL